MTGFLGVMAIVALIAITSVGTILGLYFFHFNGDWGDQEKFAQFGDFLGGVLNPIFSLLTVALLIGSLYFQRRELGQVVLEMELTREVHLSSVNMHHYLHVLKESSEQHSDLNRAAQTFRDTLSYDSITVNTVREKSFEVNHFCLFEVLSNKALFTQVEREGFTIHQRDFLGNDKIETRTLADHAEVLEAAIKTMRETVTLLKQLGCPRWRARESIEIVEDVITDYYNSSRCNDDYRSNLIKIAPTLEGLIAFCDDYQD